MAGCSGRFPQLARSEHRVSRLLSDRRAPTSDDVARHRDATTRTSQALPRCLVYRCRSGGTARRSRSVPRRARDHVRAHDTRDSKGAQDVEEIVSFPVPRSVRRCARQQPPCSAVIRSRKRGGVPRAGCARAAESVRHGIETHDSEGHHIVATPPRPKASWMAFTAL